MYSIGIVLLPSFCSIAFPVCTRLVSLNIPFKLSASLLHDINFNEPFYYCLDCSGGFFKCEDGECLQEHLKCNGFVDCSNGEDELYCYDEGALVY